MSDQALLREMVAEIEKLKAEQRRLAAMIPLYEVINENTPTQFSANQNNYDAGDYDALMLSSNAARDLTGIAGGVKGRVMRLVNVGSNNIVLRNESSSSSAANRFTSAGGSDVFLVPGEECRLYYDSTTARWRIVEFGFSGVWIPTLTLVTNISAATTAVCGYIKKGNYVQCAGGIGINPTGAGAAELGMSLPIDSSFTIIRQCGGVCTTHLVVSVSIGILADITNDRASFQWIVVDTANRNYFFTFGYQLL